MNRDRTRVGVVIGGLAAAGAWLWRTQRTTRAPASTGAAHTARLLGRAAPLLRLPTSPDREPEVLPDGSGLRCARTGRIYPVRDGVLELLVEEPVLTPTQQSLNTRVSAWAYDRSRGALLWLAGVPTFAQEVAMIQADLAVAPGDTVLDLACGHGNFTVAWAERAGADGLVIGLDLSRAMLQRAVRRIQAAQRTNVLLIRGDAERLPFADGVFAKINCSGGFHQLPDLARALRDIARVSTTDGVLTASTFAEGRHDPNARLKHTLKQRVRLHFVSLEWLTTQLDAVGYRMVRTSLPGGWFACTSARKATGTVG